MKIELCNVFFFKIIILFLKYKLYCGEMFVFICEVIWYICEIFVSVYYVYVFFGKNYFVKL